jgi:predicted nucleic acid-binding protein
VPVVDASVAVAYFRTDDSGHLRSRAWWLRMAEQGEELAAPSILLAEVGSALARVTDDDALAEAAVELLAGGEVVRLYAVGPGFAHDAAWLGIERRVRGADAVYLALAKALDTPLITLDRQQIERAGDAVTAGEPG